jgi:ElaB/YqjD/DUF883 family membrane-anchored ribosome-binding protein
MSEESARPKERIHNLHDDVEAIQREAANARAAASEVIADRIDEVAATTVRAIQGVNNRYETAAESIRAHPFTAMFAAAAVGFIVGRALR